LGLDSGSNTPEWGRQRHNSGLFGVERKEMYGLAEQGATALPSTGFLKTLNTGISADNSETCNLFLDKTGAFVHPGNGGSRQTQLPISRKLKNNAKL